MWCEDKIDGQKAFTFQGKNADGCCAFVANTEKFFCSVL